MSRHRMSYLAVAAAMLGSYGRPQSLPTSDGRRAERQAEKLHGAGQRIARAEAKRLRKAEKRKNDARQRAEGR